MSLYTVSAPEEAAARLARDPDSLMALSLPGNGLLDDIGDDVFRDVDVEASLKAARKAAWRQGPLQWLIVMMMQGEVRRGLAQARTIPPRLQEARSELVDPPTVLDLHKSWHLLHYLFTGTARDGGAPANTLLKGGREIGGDLGYGPARVVDPAVTAAFADFLATVTAEALRSRLDLQRMARLDIYCVDEGLDEDDLEELFEMVEHYLPELQAYVADAAKRGEGLAIWMA